MLDETVLLVIPSHNPDGTRARDRVVPQAARDAVRGHGPAGALPPLRGPRQQPRLVHVHAGGDPAHASRTSTTAGTRRSCTTCTRWAARGPPLRAALRRPLGAERGPARSSRRRARSARTWPSRLTTAGRTGRRHRRDLRRLDPGPRLPPHPRRRAGPLRDRLGPARDADRGEAARSSSGRGSGYDPRAASGNFPAPWPGGTWRLADIVETQLAASLAILEHAARNREYWLRTALAANRRAIARGEPFAFVMPAEQRDPLGRRAPGRGAAPGRGRGAARPASLRGGRARATRRAASSCACSSRRAPSPRRCSSGSATRTCGEHAGGPPRRPYDVTAHTLPLLLGVEVVAVSGAVRGRPRARRRRGACPPAASRARGPGSPSATRAATWWPSAGLLARGVEVRWALEPFADAGRTFPAGHPARPRLGAQHRRAARERARAPRRVRSGPQPRALRLRRPRVGLYRSWVPSMDEGWTRYVFEQEMGVGVPGAPRPRGAGGTPARPLRRDRAARPGAGSPPRRPRAGLDAGGVHGRPRDRGGRRPCAPSSRTAGRWWRSTRPRRSRSTSCGCR